MKIWLKTKDSKRKIGGSAAIETHLVGYGLQVHRSEFRPKLFDAVVCWGRSDDNGKPCLNANCNRFNKMTHLYMFEEAGILCPEVYEIHDMPPAATLKPYPWLARKVAHQKGLDIVVCQNNKEAFACTETHDFFTPWIPTRTEYRVWVFHDKVLAVYEKQFKGDEEYKGYMRNRRFGFKFVSRNMEGIDGMRELEKCSIVAVKCLDLDFGAVDVIRGKDGKFYVLEVNTAPNIDSPDRKSGIELARCIKEWVENV
jgi:hypothetical protein